MKAKNFKMKTISESVNIVQTETPNLLDLVENNVEMDCDLMEPISQPPVQPAPAKIVDPICGTCGLAASRIGWSKYRKHLDDCFAIFMDRKNQRPLRLSNVKPRSLEPKPSTSGQTTNLDPKPSTSRVSDPKPSSRNNPYPKRSTRRQNHDPVTTIELHQVPKTKIC